MFYGLNGEVIKKNIDLTKYQRKDNASKGQRILGDWIEKTYPAINLLEEFPCWGLEGQRLDFFAPSIKTAWEYHGKQHEEYTEHFHHNKHGFSRSIKLDNRKEEWCQLNNITLIIVDEEDLKCKI